MPKSKQIVPKRVENFVQNQINLKYIAKYFLNIYQSGGISPNLDTLMTSRYCLAFYQCKQLPD